MKILALTNLYPNPLQPHRAPYNRHQFRMLAALHPLRVIAPIAWTDEWRQWRRGGGSLPWQRRIIHEGLTVDHPRYWYPPKILRGLYGGCFLASIRATFWSIVAEFQPNIIFAPWAYPDGYAAVRLARQAGLPVVVQVHGSDIRELDRFPARLPGSAAAVSQADGVIAVSRDLAERVIKLGAAAERVQVVIDGVDRSVFYPASRNWARGRLGLRPDAKHLLFVGNLVEVKGIDVLLEACRQLSHRAGPWQLHLIGDGPLRAELVAQAAEKGIGPDVVFHGPISHAELPDWYRAADLFVLASRSEGVPNVLLEAAACALPFVATRVGGIAEIAHLGRCCLVSPDQPAMLANALADMLTSTQGDNRDTPSTSGSGPRDRHEAVEDIAAFLEAVCSRFAAERRQLSGGVARSA